MFLCFFFSQVMTSSGLGLTTLRSQEKKSPSPSSIILVCSNSLLLLFSSLQLSSLLFASLRSLILGFVVLFSFAPFSSLLESPPVSYNKICLNQWGFYAFNQSSHRALIETLKQRKLLRRSLNLVSKCKCIKNDNANELDLQLQ